MHYLHMVTRKPLLQVALRMLRYISPTSRLHLPYISPISPLYLPYISPISPLQVALRMLLQNHVDAILEKGFTQLMEQSRLEDLTRMYGLYAQVDALPQLRQALSGYIKRVGTAMVSDKEKDRVLVQELLAFKERLDRVLSVAFDGNELFGHALKEAFETFINGRQNRAAELIAHFIDSKLRSGNKGTSEEELEDVLDKTMTLFRYIDGKDMFEAFYKKDLSKR